MSAQSASESPSSADPFLRDQLGHRREFRWRYRRRAVIEAFFGAVKHRCGATIRSRRPDAQRVDILVRVVVWNAIAVS